MITIARTEEKIKYDFSNGDPSRICKVVSFPKLIPMNFS